MATKHHIIALGIGTLLGLLGPSPAPAVVFYATDDLAFNTSAPQDGLTNSGWQWQGRWGSFTGIPIAPRYFLTAKHVGGQVGDRLILNGAEYTATAAADAPGSDLRLWRVCGTFPTFAPLYTNTLEVGQTVVVFGRGTQRGAALSITNDAGPQLRGWYWGTNDQVLRWVENQVTEVVDGDVLLGTHGAWGSLLRATFDPDQGPNECHLSVGDSGGGVFLAEAGTWKLAGINLAVDGPFNFTDAGEGFDAALFDYGGLYQKLNGSWTLVEDLAESQPSAFYATRISSNWAWIEQVLAQPVPSEEPPTLQVAATIDGPYQDELEVEVDDVARTLTLAAPAQTEFYRLRGCTAHQIKSITSANGQLVLAY